MWRWREIRAVIVASLNKEQRTRKQLIRNRDNALQTQAHTRLSSRPHHPDFDPFLRSLGYFFPGQSIHDTLSVTFVALNKVKTFFNERDTAFCLLGAGPSIRAKNRWRFSRPEPRCPVVSSAQRTPRDESFHPCMSLSFQTTRAFPSQAARLVRTHHSTCPHPAKIKLSRCFGNRVVFASSPLRWRGRATRAPLPLHMACLRFSPEEGTGNKDEASLVLTCLFFTHYRTPITGSRQAN